MTTWLRVMNMYVFVRRFVIESRVFANYSCKLGQIKFQASRSRGFGISKRCMQMRICGNTSGRVDTVGSVRIQRKREETADIPMIPPPSRNLRDRFSL